MHTHTFRKQADAVARSTGCKGSNCFMKLPNHNRLLQTFPDAMHTVKDSIERIFFLLIGKAKLDKIRQAEIVNGRFGFEVSSRKRKRGSRGKNCKVQHPYVLSKEELVVADSRSKTITATNSDFHPESVFFRTTSLKSHDWKEVRYRGDFLHTVQAKKSCHYPAPVPEVVPLPHLHKLFPPAPTASTGNYVQGRPIAVPS